MAISFKIMVMDAAPLICAWVHTPLWSQMAGNLLDRDLQVVARRHA